MTNIDFIGRRKLWYVLSGLVILIGMVSMAFQGLNFGIDFTGGNILEVKFDEARSIDEVRVFMEDQQLRYNVQESGDSQYLIRTEELAEREGAALLDAVRTELGTVEVLRNEIVSSVIGAELTRNAILALAIASVLIIIYITIRFEFFFGLAAVAALLHDVLITVGIFSLLRMEVNSAFVAALLTIVGYSINDSIVIFDRIRENAGRVGKFTEIQMVNNSINQSLFRSIATTMALMIVLLSLFFIGGVTIRDFVLAMIVGSVAGAYSSIFIASPLWIETKRWRKNTKRKLA